MPTLPARFVRCEYCKRLLIVDAYNPRGLCTRECNRQLLDAAKAKIRVNLDRLKEK